MSDKWVKPLFIVAGLYDGLLGIAFVLFPSKIFALYGVEPPNHPAYVQFPALLLIVFSVMFFRVAARPRECRELILYGCGLKVAYCATAFWYEVTAGIPSMWIPWAWADLVFLGLFVLSWSMLSRPGPGPRDAH